jgi:hypothetical protein
MSGEDNEMGDKMTCPGCHATGSAVRMAYNDDRPCPECGLSNEAASEILRIQATRADEALKQQLGEEIRRRGVAETKLARAEYRLQQLRDALEADDPDWLIP